MLKIVVCVIVAFAVVVPAAASASTWRPGAPAFVTETEMESLLKHKADFATCRGIDRYGHRGSTYLRFDCTLEGMGNLGTCYGVQFAAQKAAVRGYFKANAVKITGGCY